MTGLDDAEELWPFVLRVYGGDNVQSACLTLQESCATDVPVLLFAAWLGRRGVGLDADAMHRLDEAVSDWRGEIVHALRRVRQRLKSGPTPAPTAATEALRSAVKAAELKAERLELALLEELSHSLAQAPDADRVALTLANLVTVAQHFGGKARAEQHHAELWVVAAAV
jgi:uncharacterized protein (TIGR02444 family)